MKKICLVNGSLRGRKASSHALLEELLPGFRGGEYVVTRLEMRAGRAATHAREAFQTMACSDAVILSFPLFAYSLPGGFIRFLEDFSRYLAEGMERYGGTRLYSIVNCGFPDPQVTGEAVRVVRNFCAATGLRYRFSVSVGCGPATLATRKVPVLNAKLKRALTAIIMDIEEGSCAEATDFLVAPSIPKGILLRVKESYEKRSGTM